MKIFNRFLALLFLVPFLNGCGKGFTDMDYPETTKLDLVEDIFGQTIEDPYRWLEDFTSPESKEWVEKQNLLTDQFLSNPYQKKIKNTLEDIWESEQISIPYKKGDKTFYFFNDGIKQQSVFMMKGCDDCEPEVLLDPNEFSKDGTISLGNVSVSPNGKKLAYSISDGGSDWRTWKVMDIETKEDICQE